MSNGVLPRAKVLDQAISNTGSWGISLTLQQPPRAPIPTRGTVQQGFLPQPLLLLTTNMNGQGEGPTLLGITTQGAGPTQLLQGKWILKPERSSTRGTKQSTIGQKTMGFRHGATGGKVQEAIGFLLQQRMVRDPHLARPCKEGSVATTGRTTPRRTGRKQGQQFVQDKTMINSQGLHQVRTHFHRSPRASSTAGGSQTAVNNQGVANEVVQPVSAPRGSQVSWVREQSKTMKAGVKSEEPRPTTTAQVNVQVTKENNRVALADQRRQALFQRGQGSEEIIQGPALVRQVHRNQTHTYIYIYLYEYIDVYRHFSWLKIEIHPDSVNWGLAPGSIANFWGHAATWDLWWCAASVQAFEMFQHGASGAPSSLQGQPKSCNMPRSMKNPVASSPGSCEAIPPTCSTKYASQGEKIEKFEVGPA